MTVHICWAAKQWRPPFLLYSLVAPTWHSSNRCWIDFIRITCRVCYTWSRLSAPTPRDQVSVLPPQSRVWSPASLTLGSVSHVMCFVWPMECGQKVGPFETGVLRGITCFGSPYASAICHEKSGPRWLLFLPCMLEWETWGADLNPGPAQPSWATSNLYTCEQEMNVCKPLSFLAVFVTQHYWNQS